MAVFKFKDDGGNYASVPLGGCVIAPTWAGIKDKPFSKFNKDTFTINDDNELNLVDLEMANNELLSIWNEVFGEA